jgi:nanoRNase/pAp phosphatase (c-di-AMP/oligoRNAs hydrolase)
MRIVTRGDMDGLTGSVIVALNEEVEDDIKLIHPQDITDGREEILPDDIVINLPYNENCCMWFDHHKHTATYEKPPDSFKGAYGHAPSAARLVYEYYGGKEKMPQLEDLVRETDRMDSADLAPEDVLDPKGYILLGFTIDSRTGIGAFKEYFKTLQALLSAGNPLSEILEHPEVKKRCHKIKANDAAYRVALRENSRVEGNVVVTNFRGLEELPIGNRFLVYALYPEVNVSVRTHWGPQKKFVVAVIGHSIFNRTCSTAVGELAARYGGGGHPGAGSIPLAPETADEQLAEIIEELKRNG